MLLHNLETILQYPGGPTFLTAITFSEPAFNVLWYELQSI